MKHILHKNMSNLQYAQHLFWSLRTLGKRSYAMPIILFGIQYSQCEDYEVVNSILQLLRKKAANY